MQMHQVRYFVTLARTLNFTRAADDCNVAQPALTRAIKALEDELGGELIRREGRASHLTELGQRMLPMLTQCYESALTAKSAARSMKAGDAGAFGVGVSNSIDLRTLDGPLAELFRIAPALHLRVRRGDARNLIALLKAGEIEVAIAGPFDHRQERLDVWPLYEDRYGVFVAQDHPLAAQSGAIAPCAVHDAGYIRLANTEGALNETERFAEVGLAPERAHEVDASQDLACMMSAAKKAAVAPQSAVFGEPLVERPIGGLTFTRVVSAYAVNGRPRSREADAFLTLVRTVPWREVLAEAPPLDH